jgi:hypothetical protein
MRKSLVDTRFMSLFQRLKLIFSVYGRNLMISYGLLVLQQLGGANIMLYYAPEIIRQAGFLRISEF